MAGEIGYFIVAVGTRVTSRLSHRISKYKMVAPKRSCAFCGYVHVVTSALPSSCFAITCDKCVLAYVDVLMEDDLTDWDQDYDEGDYVWFYVPDVTVEDVTPMQQD